MLEQRRLALAGLRKIGNHCRNWALPHRALHNLRSRFIVASTLQSKHSSVTIFAVAREEIQIKVSHEILARRVRYLIHLDIWVPNLFGVVHLGENQRKDCLIGLYEPSLHFGEREVSPHLILVNGVFALFEQRVVIIEIPRVEFAIEGLAALCFFLFLECLEHCELLVCWRNKPRDQLIIHFIHGSRFFRHADLKLEVSVRFVSQNLGDLRAQTQGILQQRRVHFLALARTQLIEGLACFFAFALLHSRE
mmetsp:Transcript_34154/g.55122  ORF Transcript_34154/g.55122 Transcript_34154/m.55122 type:complete len:250 (-) Transcript_34154:694-1443(-)